MTLLDGSVMRAVELTPLGALAASPDVAERALGHVTDLLGELAPGELLQWYVESRPVELHDPWAPDADPVAVEQRTHLLLRCEPGRRAVARLARAGASPFAAAHERSLERSLERIDALALHLHRAGLRPRLLDGAEMSRLLLRRLRGSAAPAVEPRVEVVGAFDARAEARRGVAAAERLLELLGQVEIDFGDDRVVKVGGQLEQAIAVGGTPGAAARDWLAPLVTIGERFAFSIHARAREDGHVDLSACQSVCEPGPRPDGIRLAGAVDGILREALAANGVRVDRGEFVQRALWPATLPLAIAPVTPVHRVDASVAAAALPLLGDRCGSPSGVPFALASDGSIERLDPWDLAHRHAGMIVAGGSPRERAEVAVVVAARLSAGGAAVVVLDAEGELTRLCGERLGDAATVVAATTPGALAPVADLAGAGSVVAIGAAQAERLLPLAGAATALLAAAPGVLREDPSEPAPPGAGALVVAGADRLLREPGGALWLRRTLARARRDGCCAILLSAEAAPFEAAHTFPLLPVRVLLGQPPDGTALWRNGDRGRALVQILDLPDVAEAA